jgi:hypothetical protein
MFYYFVCEQIPILVYAKIARVEIAAPHEKLPVEFGVGK